VENITSARCSEFVVFETIALKLPASCMVRNSGQSIFSNLSGIPLPYVAPGTLRDSPNRSANAEQRNRFSMQPATNKTRDNNNRRLRLIGKDWRDVIACLVDVSAMNLLSTLRHAALRAAAAARRSPVRDSLRGGLQHATIKLSTYPKTCFGDQVVQEGFDSGDQAALLGFNQTAK
jgi:hypothetical protein